MPMSTYAKGEGGKESLKSQRRPSGESDRGVRRDRGWRLAIGKEGNWSSVRRPYEKG